jgi:CHAT domain-containing protein/tetratricopeptide (TPR) repeat protein
MTARRLAHVVVTAALLCACGRHSEPSLDELARSARLAIWRGELPAAETAIERGLAATAGDADSERAWSFKLLQAELLLEQRTPARAVELLGVEPPAEPRFDALRARQTYLIARAQRDRDQLPQALETLSRAREMAPDARDVQLAIDWLDGQIRFRQRQWADGERRLTDVVGRATGDGDRPQLAMALNDLAMSHVRRGRYDEALIWFERLLALRDLEQFTIYAQALSNAGICYGRLGLFDQAISSQQRAIEILRPRGPSLNLAQALGGLGNNQRLRGEGQQALPLLREAFTLAQQLGLKSEAALWAGNLASAYASLELWDEAERFNEQATHMAASPDTTRPVVSVMVAAEIAAGRGDFSRATALFEEALADPSGGAVVEWSARGQLATVAIAQRDPERAAKHFKAALAAIEKTRIDLLTTDFKLSFLPKQVEFYRDYVDFLVEQGNIDQAFEIADSFRGRLLAEQHRVAAPLQTRTPALRQFAARSHKVLLSYWLSPRRSYLWVVTGDGTRKIDLPPASEIEAAVREHRAMIDNSLADPLARTGSAGDRLYQLLIAPAAIPAGASVVVVADGALHGLNFETLPVDGESRHYWIEDAEVQVAPSLSLLTAARPRPKSRPDELLLIGNPTPRIPEFPALSYAPAEMTGIVQHFPKGQVTSYDGEEASPAVYRKAPLDQFAMIHFTAHATANVDSPLDSAVVLSGPDNGYKLYARDVADTPLRADLVTVSACRSAGERTYSGEGLVGFAWAFLRAGARNVIAGLWDVDDRSTARLMDALYLGLSQNRTPATALRNAKLDLIKQGGQLARPYYWGPFQLFTVAP